MELATTHSWREGASVSQKTSEEASRAEALAFQGFVERQQRFVFRVAYAMMRDRAEADDVVQETFLRLYRKRAWHGLDNERAYLARVAWRLCRDRQRRPAREEGGADLDALTAEQSTPEGAAISNSTTAAIHRMIDALPEELRQPLVLATLEEMTSAQVGAVLGIPEGTVRTRIQRARQLLKQKLRGVLK